MFTSLLGLVLILSGVIASAYLRLKPTQWAPALLILLAIITVFTWVPGLIMFAIWAVFLLIVFVVHFEKFRRSFLIKPLVNIFKNVLPQVSATEKAALDAGKVWWEGELFRGSPNWQQLFDIPKPRLSDEERAFLENQVETVCGMLNDWEVVQDADLPEAVWEYLKKERFFGMLIPKQYGGLEFSALAQSTIVAKIATRCLSAAVTTMVPNSLGPAELLIHYGTEDQKQYYLPRLAIGDEVPCFALTSTEGGSDPGAMFDQGIVCKQMHNGQETLGILLNFDKRYITLAPKATVIGLAFKLYDPEGLIGDKKDIGITCALIPASHPDMEVGDRHYPCYLSFPNGPVRGKDLFIPMERVIGGQAMVGQGWRMLMECLSAGRGISLPALGAAAGKLTYRMTGAYAKLREQFKVSIGQFEGVQELLAKQAGLAYLLESSRLFTAGAVDLVGKPSLASAIAKYHMTEMCREAFDIAMDIHSGRAIQAGPRNYLLNLYLSIPIAITVEGANILTRNLMIFGQGAIRCHPFILKEMEALTQTDSGKQVSDFDHLFMQHVGYGLHNFARTLVMGLTRARFVEVNGDKSVSRYLKQLTRMSSALALLSDMSLLLLGGELKRREFLSARLGDVLSYLYLASAALKYYADHEQNEVDAVHLKWSIDYCLWQMQEAIFGALDNFPSKIAGFILRWTVFPWGRSYRKPSDATLRKIADYAMQDTAFRDRVTEHMYLSNDPNDAAGRVELAFKALSKAQPLLKKLRSAIKKRILAKNLSLAESIKQAVTEHVLTADEAEQLLEFDKLRFEALKVDEFSSDFFPKKSN